MILRLVSGHRYIAGVSLPWWLPRSLVPGKLADTGVTDIHIAAADEPSVLSTVPQALLSEVNTVGDGVFSGSDEQSAVEVPSQIRWILDATTERFVLGGYVPAAAGLLPGNPPSPIEPSPQSNERRARAITAAAYFFAGALGGLFVARDRR